MIKSLLLGDHVATLIHDMHTRLPKSIKVWNWTSNVLHPPVIEFDGKVSVVDIEWGATENDLLVYLEGSKVIRLISWQSNQTIREFDLMGEEISNTPMKLVRTKTFWSDFDTVLLVNMFSKIVMYDYSTGESFMALLTLPNYNVCGFDFNIFGVFGYICKAKRAVAGHQQLTAFYEVDRGEWIELNNHHYETMFQLSDSLLISTWSYEKVAIIYDYGC